MAEELLRDLPRTLPAFVQRFGTDAKCRACLVRALWPEGFRCAGCWHCEAYSHKNRLIEPRAGGSTGRDEPQGSRGLPSACPLPHGQSVRGPPMDTPLRQRRHREPVRSAAYRPPVPPERGPDGEFSGDGATLSGEREGEPELMDGQGALQHRRGAPWRDRERERHADVIAEPRSFLANGVARAFRGRTAGAGRLPE